MVRTLAQSTEEQATALERLARGDLSRPSHLPHGALPTNALEWVHHGVEPGANRGAAA